MPVRKSASHPTIKKIKPVTRHIQLHLSLRQLSTFNPRLQHPQCLIHKNLCNRHQLLCKIMESLNLLVIKNSLNFLRELNFTRQILLISKKTSIIQTLRMAISYNLTSPLSGINFGNSRINNLNNMKGIRIRLSTNTPKVKYRLHSDTMSRSSQMGI